VSFQLTPQNVEIQSWVTKTVCQQIPGQRACNSETPTTITVQSIPRNDQLPLTGRPQMSMRTRRKAIYRSKSFLVTFSNGLC